jgi:hypothetical protein
LRLGDCPQRYAAQQERSQTLSDHQKSLVSNLLKGLLFGIGFMTVAVAGSHFLAHPFERPLTVVIADQATGDSQTAKIDFKEDLTIVSYISYKELKTKSQLNILGKIKNTGNITWTAIEIQAELFKNDQYVDECQEYIRILKPNEEDNFKITCGECNDYTIPEHDKLVLKVAAAHQDKNR